jgi:tetratricopeptide (TPR) repeat protein
VVVSLFFAVGQLIEWIFRWTSVNLDDTVFLKDQAAQVMKADEEREKNIVPIEEALVISDNDDLRGLMMHVIKGDVESSLAAISQALNSRDTETSHYAASALSKELNDFRLNVQKILQEIRWEEEHDPEDLTECIRYERLLFDYMNRILKQQVFTSVEQGYFVQVIAQMGEKLQAQSAMTAEMDAELAQRLMEIGAYKQAGNWCDRAMEENPGSLAAYQCRLKLFFLTRQREAFLETLQSLRISGITVDSETLDMLRAFQ